MLSKIPLAIGLVISCPISVSSVSGLDGGAETLDSDAEDGEAAREDALVYSQPEEVVRSEILP